MENPKMNSPERISNVCARRQPDAFIRVDGADFMDLEKGDNFYKLFNETVEHVGGEVALYVWKQRYDAYFRERLSITATKTHETH